MKISSFDSFGLVNSDRLVIFKTFEEEVDSVLRRNDINMIING